MYQKIVNPKTNRKISINSKLGKSIIKSYYNALVTGGSPWNNPLGDPEVADKIWNDTKPAWFETEERMKKRNRPPSTPFSIKLKMLGHSPVTVDLIQASDSVEGVVEKWIAHCLINGTTTPEAATKLTESLYKFEYYYHPFGPGNGPPIPIKDGKKHDMHRLRAGSDSMIHVGMKPVSS